MEYFLVSIKIAAPPPLLPEEREPQDMYFSSSICNTSSILAWKYKLFFPVFSQISEMSKIESPSFWNFSTVDFSFGRKLLAFATAITGSSELILTLWFVVVVGTTLFTEGKLWAAGLATFPTPWALLLLSLKLLSLLVSAPSHCNISLNWPVPKDEYVQIASFSPVWDESCGLLIWMFNEQEDMLETALVTFKVEYVQNDWALLFSPPSSQEGKSSFPAPQTCSGLEAGIACSPGEGEQGGRAVSGSQPMRREEADYSLDLPRSSASDWSGSPDPANITAILRVKVKVWKCLHTTAFRHILVGKTAASQMNNSVDLNSLVTFTG